MKEVEVSAWKTASQSLEQVFVFMFPDVSTKIIIIIIPDILDKSVSASSQTRWLEAGQQTALSQSLIS